MATISEVKVVTLLDGPFAVSTEDGEKLFHIINQKFEKSKPIKVDFDKIELIVSTFLNASIGQLYGIYPVELIQKNLTIKNMTNEDLSILKKVTDRAKEYFKDKRKFDNAFKKNFPDASKE